MTQLKKIYYFLFKDFLLNNFLDGSENGLIHCRFTFFHYELILGRQLFLDNIFWLTEDYLKQSL